MALTTLLSVGCADVDAGLIESADAAQAVDGSVNVDALLDAGRSVELDAATDSRRFEKLIDNQRWRRYDAGLDPLPSHQPASIVCWESATYVEYGSYEVDTTRCNYLLAEHPALRELPAGSDVRLSLLHYDLLAPEPAQAHVALLFGDALQWETHLVIPRAGDMVRASFKTNRTLQFGEPIRLHLHNHGGNTYLLVSLEAAE